MKFLDLKWRNQAEVIQKFIVYAQALTLIIIILQGQSLSLKTVYFQVSYTVYMRIFWAEQFRLKSGSFMISKFSFIQASVLKVLDLLNQFQNCIQNQTISIQVQKCSTRILCRHKQQLSRVILVQMRSSENWMLKQFQSAMQFQRIKMLLQINRVAGQLLFIRATIRLEPNTKDYI
ncbi:Hypothetical_protein [Hexamita inflata]|uniref:Hypothetical_protein n=1 Tax=Hexamita inflata TaxID=28002 RepID=A0AA86QU32_9EUKA|nr:Hypothetical protein HINF_LOCUS51823 [Hexamita inflata]